MKPKFWGWVVIVFFVYFIAKNPNGAANVGKSGFGLLIAAANGVAAMLTAIAG